jgi:hypothetical protein
LLLFVCEYHIVQNVNNQHQQLTSLPSSLPDEQEDNDDDSDSDDADATKTCASDNKSGLIESLESIDWTTDSEDNELYHLCWDNDEEILVLGKDDNRQGHCWWQWQRQH